MKVDLRILISSTIINLDQRRGPGVRKMKIKPPRYGLFKVVQQTQQEKAFNFDLPMPMSTYIKELLYIYKSYCWAQRGKASITDCNIPGMRIMLERGNPLFIKMLFHSSSVLSFPPEESANISRSNTKPNFSSWSAAPSTTSTMITFPVSAGMASLQFFSIFMHSASLQSCMIHCTRKNNCHCPYIYTTLSFN